MALYDELTAKQRRTIKRDLGTIISLKGMLFPNQLDELKANIDEVGFYPVHLKNKDSYLTKDGLSALRRINDSIYLARQFEHLLSYDDIFQAALSEIARWVNLGGIPDDGEFIPPLEEKLLTLIDAYTFACKVDGVLLEGIDKIIVGSYEIRRYAPSLVNGLNQTNTDIVDSINRDFTNCYLIVGSETGSHRVALEKFYYNAEQSLSILRLYSCALYKTAIYRLNILLFNEQRDSSSFGWKNSDKSFTYNRHAAKQELTVGNEFLSLVIQRFCFSKASSLISKKDKNELENAIVKSIYWIGEAQKDPSTASSWVKLWASVECYFTRNNKEVTEANARGISSVLVHGGFLHEEYNDYKSLKQKIKKYYSLRSKTVHHAEFNHIDEHDLADFGYIVAWVIVTMVSLLNKGYTSLDQIQAQVENSDTTESDHNK
ncbi:HEPN domain-containing protein [Mariprofundus ferrooxydans]|uniref:HEPN domain-containing protein n=1 Tax=Mariprofundus ferrooxydans TaxID=314344 RepID=UPI0014307C63|nr:HEPN domain-containing protein [Mariprofundus ferrooxydans]